MQLTIRSITRGVLAGTLPGAAVLSMALLSGSAWAQSSSGSSGSSQSSGSQSSSQENQNEGEERAAERSRSQDDDSQYESRQRQRSSSGLGQANRDRDSDTTGSQQRRSQRSQEDDQSQYSQGQSSQRTRGLGQSNRDRSEDDYSRQQSRSRSSGQADDDRTFSQSDRQRSSSRTGSQSRDDQYQDDQYSEGRRSRQSDDFQSRDRSFSQGQSSTRSSGQRQLGLSFSSSQDEGLVISNVNPQSIAATSGLRSGDEIVAINGRRIQSREEWVDWIESSQGRRLNVLVRRNGREVPVTLATTGRMSQSQGFAQDEYDYARDSDYGSRASLGVVLDPRYQQGAMVDRVYRDSPAEQAGLQRGDYIISVDGQRVNSPQDLVRIINRMEPGSDVELEFTRRQRDSANVTLGSQGERQDGSFSLTQERRSGSNQRSAARQQRYDESDEFRD